MSQISDVTALSGYQVQNTNLLSQIAALNSQIQGLQNQIPVLQAEPQSAYGIEGDYGGTSGPYSYSQANSLLQPGQSVVTFPTAAASQISQINLQISNLQNQITPLQSQQTSLSQIISQLQTNITQYDTPKPISLSNPTTASDTAHNIATGFTSALSSIPKTDLYIGLGILGLLLLL